ncbi:unnamed protein product [Penicillium salamii]|uniref:WD repeat protein n=1 Tax=Penicillium salamii TaxID=1612424 RepID=A0A9W4I781_9EURO|nr:unnamed protein product [Penicillium salamii]CAG7968859.1 unnamed protein product [Penicillium salamii]CAG8040299.1 unnamed protein product [Penicillium salamii]CAG8066651.1 unnamed protein product [Penicillium salamii]CAG8209704.1 unnamed protein product [Penicillium salamii]
MMSDLSGSRSPLPPPPPPPPQKYSNRAANALARFAQPFFSGSRPPSPQSSRADGTRPIRSKSLPGEPQTVTHKTGIAIAALDISPDRTHAVIGGKEILKTIRVSPDHSSEEFNIRNAVISYASTHHNAGVSMPHKDQLNVNDVKWSHGNYDRIIATAVANGRIVVYDLQRPGLQLCRFQGHNRQVHKLAFNPHLPSWLLSGSQDGTIRMWDLRSASANRGTSTCGSKHSYQGNSDSIRDVRWSPTDGVVFATASDSGAIQMWDYRKVNAPLMRIAAHDRPCFAVDWHPDGKHIVSGGTDRQVKVWDFSSSAERRQKPAFQFRTPQAVTNVRWRPPSWVGESPASGEWQSSQVVTSYDKEDPRVHLWDLRRPYVPFREFDRYDDPATDLLWRSKDLLWTVGEAGAFTQTDVRYAPTVVTRRPMCSVAWSPNGDFVAFGQPRPRRRARGVNVAEFLHLEEDEEDSNGEKSLSQSPIDDNLDEAVLATSLRHAQSKSAAIRPSKSLGSTPPGAVDLIPVLPLDQGLAKITTPGPCQVGTIANIPGATNDPAVFRYLASHYTSLMDEGRDTKNQTETLNSLIASLDHNAECADELALDKLAQTWRILRYAILQEFQQRTREQPAKGSLKDRTSKDGSLTDRSRIEDGRQDRVKSRLFKGVMEAVPETESTSNMTTPLAQPLPDSPKDSWSSTDSQIASQLPSLSEDAIDIDPLPPSVLSDHNGWGMSGSDTHRIPLPRGRVSSMDDTQGSDYLRDPTQDDLDGDQRSAPRAIAGKADWRRRGHPEFLRESSADDFDQNIEDNRAAIRDYKHYPKKVLTLESPMESNRPPPVERYGRHDSSESFPMFSTSTDSSHPSKSAGASYSSTGQLDSSKFQDSGQSVTRPATTLRRESNLASTREEPEDEMLDEVSMEMSRLHLERPSSPPPLIKESTPLEEHVEHFPAGGAPYASTMPLPYSTLDGISRVQIPLSSDGTDLKPWGIEAILQEAVRYYHSSSSSVDIQTAAHILQKLHILFRDCEEILPYEESEMVFKTYNEHLIRHSMDLEAAELRLSCVSTYPAVYDYAQSDSFINVYCYTCQRPFENPTQDNTRCHRCNTPQAACSICMSLDPPPEWVTGQRQSHTISSTLTSPEPGPDGETSFSSQSSVPTEPVPASEIADLDPFTAPRLQGSALWTWCQGCGHGGHLACITTWLGDISISEGGCATAGCSHDCGPGPRRDSNRQALQAESKRRDSASRSAGAGLVKRDPWTKGESKAVEKVRGMLGVAGVAAASGGSGAGPITSTNNNTSTPAPVSPGAMSPKRVRLVTPNEQEEEQNDAFARMVAP